MLFVNGIVSIVLAAALTGLRLMLVGGPDGSSSVTKITWASDTLDMRVSNLSKDVLKALIRAKSEKKEQLEETDDESE